VSDLDPSAVPFVATNDVKGQATEFSCSLCGARFTHGTLVCVSCPLNAGCEVVKCPSCGFQSPRRSRIVDAVVRFWRSGERP
jgi:NAD-dependent SIR2 family protein deacetylase